MPQAQVQWGLVLPVAEQVRWHECAGCQSHVAALPGPARVSQGIDEVNEKRARSFAVERSSAAAYSASFAGHAQGLPEHLRRLQEELNITFGGPKPARGSSNHVFKQFSRH